MKRFLTRLSWVLIALIVLLLAGVIVARAMFNHYLHSEAFRHSLSQGAATALHADEADFSPLQFDGSLVYGDNFHATRTDGGGFSSIDADQLRATFDWHGLLHRTVQIDEVSVQRLNIEAPAVAAAIPESLSAPPESGMPFTLGHKDWTVDLRKAVIDEVNWHWSPDATSGVTGAALTLTPDGQNWIMNVQGGAVHQAGWPELRIESAAMRWQPPTLYINSSTLRSGESHLSVTGEIRTRDSVDLKADFDGVDIHPLLAPDWRERLAGKLSGHADIQAPLGENGAAGAVTVSGSISLTDGELTALPVLDEIGLFTQTERFRRLELTRASAQFTQAPDHLEVRNMVVESAGLIRAEGSYTVRDGQINGTFLIGLTPATLQWIPGSQEQIFIDSRDGYRWTTMRLTGPAAHPVDDLTPRLVAATGNQVIQGVQGVEGAVKKGVEQGLDMLLH